MLSGEMQIGGLCIVVLAPYDIYLTNNKKLCNNSEVGKLAEEGCVIHRMCHSFRC